MFDIGTEQDKEEMEKQKYKFEEYDELPEKELLSMEKEMLGIYISGHPLEKLKEQIIHCTNISTLDLAEGGSQMSDFDARNRIKLVDGQRVKYAGIITSIKKKYTKNNKIMAFITIEDLYGVAEIIAFENTVINAGRSLVEENIVIVDGRLSIREDEQATIIANEIKDLGEEKRQILSIDITNLSEEKKERLRSAIKYFCGDKNNIGIQIEVNGEVKPCGQIYFNEEILQIFQEIVGDKIKML